MPLSRHFRFYVAATIIVAFIIAFAWAVISVGSIDAGSLQGLLVGIVLGAGGTALLVTGAACVLASFRYAVMWLKGPRGPGQ